jgi:hypothetical protein
MKELDQAFIELPRYAIIKLVGCDEAAFNKMRLTEAIRVSEGF